MSGCDERLDRLEAVVAAAQLGFCSVTAGKRVLHASSQFKAELGLAPDADLEWDAILARIDPDERREFERALEAVLHEAAAIDLEVRVRWPDDSCQFVALRARAAIDLNGSRSAILISRNVTASTETARREESGRAAVLAQERRLRELAEAANRAKDTFLSVVSHELRSPLNAILGWNRILSVKRAGESEVVDITRRIEQSARTQLKMVNDLLDVGRIGTGKLRVDLRPLHLTKAAAAAVDLARPAAEAKGIALVAQLDAEVGQVRADPDRLQQIIGNLLSNAIKFTPVAGCITVKLHHSGAYAELAVEDTGQGISPELLPHVFERFLQGDSSSTRHAGGLGLGLTLVRELVALHGGSVCAYSEGPGTGSTFVMRLPAIARRASSNGDAPGCSQRSTTPESLQGLSILVVDDEADARTVVAETLRLEGARVTVVDSARNALEAVRVSGSTFDVIVTDIGMPEEDGYSLVRRLRGLQAGRRMLAIAVTGYASRSDVEAAMRAGFDLHVPKPVDLDAFVPMVSRLAAIGRSVQEGSAQAQA